jgi:hypothetical protein
MEIENKVDKSGLIQIDIKSYLKANSEFIGFDFKPVLWNELVLKEKDFRDFCKTHDWEQYKDKYVYLYCSVDAVLPSWSYLLVTTFLHGISTKTVIGTINEAKREQLLDAINQLDLTEFKDGKMIVKGCSDVPYSNQILSSFISKVQSVASSIMFGEPCSTVPLYKKPKK